MRGLTSWRGGHCSFGSGPPSGASDRSVDGAARGPNPARRHSTPAPPRLHHVASRSSRRTQCSSQVTRLRDSARRIVAALADRGAVRALLEDLLDVGRPEPDRGRKSTLDGARGRRAGTAFGRPRVTRGAGGAVTSTEDRGRAWRSRLPTTTCRTWSHARVRGDEARRGAADPFPEAQRLLPDPATLEERCTVALLREEE